MFDTREQAFARRRVGRTSRRASVVVIGMAVLVAACSSPPTVSAFTSQANGICRTYRPQLGRIDSAIALSNSAEAGRLRSALSDALGPTEQGASQLEALSQPNGESGALKKAFGALDAQIKELKGLASALEQGNTDTIQSSETALEESEAPLNQRFDVLGLTECGSGSTS